MLLLMNYDYYPPTEGYYIVEVENVPVIGVGKTREKAIVNWCYEAEQYANKRLVSLTYLEKYGDEFSENNPSWDAFRDEVEAKNRDANEVLLHVAKVRELVRLGTTDTLFEQMNKKEE